MCITWFFSNKKIVSINHQAFALPNDTRVTVEFKEKNKTKTINFSKDDTIKNFIQECLQAIKLKKYDMYYKNILFDSKIREELRLK